MIQVLLYLVFIQKMNIYSESVNFLEGCLNRKFGIKELWTSDYVINETITTIFARTKSFEIAKKFGNVIINSKAMQKVWTENKRNLMMRKNFLKRKE